MEIWAHRGSHDRGLEPGSAPLENTLPAFELALAEGAQGIELDVWASCDGEAVVIHDEWLGRLSAGADERDLRTLTAAEIALVELRGGHRIPTLRAVLHRVAGRVPINVELKSVAAAAPVARVLAQGDWPVVVSSFEVAALEAMRDCAPQVPRALLTETLPEGEAPLAQLRALGCVAWHAAQQGLGAEAVRAAQALLGPQSVRTWTVNDAQRAAQLAAAGVAAVMTDHPARLRRALEALRVGA